MNLNSESQVISFSWRTTWALPQGFSSMLPRAQNDDQWGTKVRKYVNREVTSEFCLFPSLDSDWQSVPNTGPHREEVYTVLTVNTGRTVLLHNLTLSLPCSVRLFIWVFPSGRAALFARTSVSAERVTLDFRIATTGPICHVNKETRGNGKRSGTSRGGSAKWTPRSVGHCGELLLSLTHFLVLYKWENGTDLDTRRVYTWSFLHYLIIVWLT